MSLLPFILIFFLGACVGSFSAVLLEEASPKRSFWTGRSHCLGCKKILAWYELIPLVSYALQKGKCRTCHAEIPRWIWYMEWFMAFLWMVSAMVFSLAGLSYFSSALHIVVLTGLSLLVIEDMRSRIISDTRSIPLMGVLFCIFIFLIFIPVPTLLPSPLMALVGAFVGMVFYMAQMILPALGAVLRQHKASLLPAILFSPFVFPLWMVAKALLGEKKADTLFPSLQAFDDLPSWVGGGDIRLGIIIGAMAGPYDFLYVVMYGYLAGTIYFLIRLLVFREKMKTMPVAPLLFLGICTVWCLQIFS